MLQLQYTFLFGSLSTIILQPLSNFNYWRYSTYPWDGWGTNGILALVQSFSLIVAVQLSGGGGSEFPVVLGREFSGVVQAVSADVHTFEHGDQVGFHLS